MIYHRVGFISHPLLEEQEYKYWKAAASSRGNADTAMLPTPTPTSLPQQPATEIRTRHHLIDPVASAKHRPDSAEGQGLMREALTTAIDFVFRAYGLHRIMANYCQENQRSSQLLAHLGFEIEGKARTYLKINGEWSDHILSSRINESI